MLGTSSTTGYIQGRIVTHPKILDGITVPPGEMIVEIPLSLITDLTAEEAAR